MYYDYYKEENKIFLNARLKNKSFKFKNRKS